jgi:DNA-directed RNA polymerase specialized sigma24 family protein
MFAENSSSLILFAGAVLALWLVMRRGASPRQLAGRQSREDEPPRRWTARGAPHAPHAADDAPVDFLRWQVEMHETARTLKGELDSKLAALQALVIMARQESERLEAALALRPSAQAHPPIEPLPSSDSLFCLARLAEPDQLADRAALAAAAKALPTAPEADPFGDDADQDRQTSEIHRLADHGLPASEIAMRLGLPLGEVELRLSLRHS